MSNIAETYIAVAERIVGYCLNHQQSIDDLRVKLPDGTLFPQEPNLAAVWEAMLEIRVSGREISPESVADEAIANPTYLTSLLASESHTSGGDFETLIDILIKRGGQTARRRVGQRLQAGKIDGAQAIAELEALDAYGYQVRDTSSKALADRFKQLEQLPPRRCNPTGIAPVDASIWQFPIGKTTIIGAEYKGWKSRVMKNFVLGMASRGARSFVVLAEGNIDEFTRDCFVMIANLLILRSGKWDSPYNALPLTGEYVAGSREYLSNPLQSRAMEVAETIFRTLPLQVWDHADGANNPASILSESRQLVKNGTSVVAIDYIQDVDFPGGTIYEQMVVARRWVRTMKNLGSEQDDPDVGLHILLLSQKNEESIKSKKTRHAGLRGGGDLAQEADNMFAPSYDDATEGIVKVPLKFSRTNRKLSMQFAAEVNSGVLLSYPDKTGGGVPIDTAFNIVPVEQYIQRSTQQEMDDLI